MSKILELILALPPDATRWRRLAWDCSGANQEDFDGMREALYRAGKTFAEADAMLRAVFFPVPPPGISAMEDRVGSYRSGAPS